MVVVLGIDGGGTKTAAVIIDQQGRLLGSGMGGPSTYGVVPLEVTRDSIWRAASAAAAQAGLEQVNFTAAFLGLGNVTSPRDRAAIHNIALESGLASPGMIGVDHDIRIALAGGLAGRPGMVMIAGTGASCFGMNAAGESWRAGGWGPLIDDEGSSYWLGLQAMRAAVLDYDGRGSTTGLTQAVMDRLALNDINDIMNRLYAEEMTRTQIASLAPMVFTVADQGDAVAGRLIRQGCEAMAACVVTVAERLGLAHSPSELALVGGLTHAGEAFLGPFGAALVKRLPQCQLRQAEFAPAIGAALLALQMTGQAVDESLLDTIRQSI